ncbi:MAG: hypothetical protein AAB559_02090, partial [Patescibacteria group bacterium]
MQFKFRKYFSHFIIPLFLFLGTFLIYKNIYSNPRNWYDHYLYLTKSIIQGRVDIPNLPSFYHDKLIFDDKTYIPFPPGASFLLIPFVFLNENITQQQVSIFIGAIDIVLIYLLLLNFTTKKNSIILSIFFGFGTSFFWSAIVGTTWFFAHVAAIFFLTISLLFHFKQKYFWSGIFFAFSALTRIPLILSGVFYLSRLFKQKKKFISFLVGAFIFVPIFLFYNFLRFGDIFETGYEIIYKQYKSSGIKYSVGENFGYFNYKNIPLHLYTFFVMPPIFDPLRGLKPSPFGMGILFTSPLLFIALKPKFKKGIELEAIITAVICAIPSFFHYAQGWVQFGYRFVLDFIVFLMIVLALRFRPL